MAERGIRITALGVVMTLGFSALGARMWYLQAVAAEEFEAVAEDQRLAEIQLDSPRGDIVDASGEVLVTTRASLTLVYRGFYDRATDSFDPEGAQDYLEPLLGLTRPEIEDMMDTPPRGPYTGVVVGEDVAPDDAAYVIEHPHLFPGVTVEVRFVREYPQGTLAAHVLGYVQEVSDADLALFEGYQLSDLIGRDGVERTYEADLRGTPTVRNLEVDQAGEVLAEAGVLEGSAGNTVQLTLRSDVQQIAEQALYEGILAARGRGHPATAGSIVVLDPNNGDVIAMASLPSYDPAEFVGGISPEVWEVWRSEGARNPLTNRAIQAFLPPASTFKLVTYIAGVEGGVVEPGTPVECKPALEFQYSPDAPVFTKKNWAYPAHQGTLNLHEAFWQSCDIYFWEIALDVWRNRDGVGDGARVFPEDLIQQWARSLGFDEPTGIDLPHETGGVVGDRAWFDPLYAAGSRQVRQNCETPCPWSGGDVMDIAIGQGALAVTPLQLAVAYSAAVNGGTVWVPHTVDRVVDPVSGQPVRAVDPEVARILDIAPSLVASIRADLHGVVTGGTAASTFATSNVADLAGGKTGTGQASGGRHDYAWFVGVAPWYDPQYVVAAVIEEGGHGGESAAPVVKVVLEYLMGRTMTSVESGALTD